MIKKKAVKPGKSLADRGIFVRAAMVVDPNDTKAETDKKYMKAGVMLDTFAVIWSEREHICFETGIRLTEEPLTLYFHHILPKAKYPRYENAKWNIVLLHPDAHSQVETFIDKCPRVKALADHLKIVYG